MRKHTDDKDSADELTSRDVFATFRHRLLLRSWQLQRIQSVHQWQKESPLEVQPLLLESRIRSVP